MAVADFYSKDGVEVLNSMKSNYKSVTKAKRSFFGTKSKDSLAPKRASKKSAPRKTA